MTPLAVNVRRTVVAELNKSGQEKSAYLSERTDTIAMLRRVCEEHGENDWPDDLHLADVIDKHLWRHVERSE